MAQKKGALKEKTERLETFVSRLQESLPEGLPSDSVLGEVGNNSVGQDVAIQMGKLRLYESGSTQWVGPSHWESIIDDVCKLVPPQGLLTVLTFLEIADVKAYLDLEKDLDNPDTGLVRDMHDQSVPDVDVFLGAPQIFSIHELLNSLPSKVEMDRFVAQWFNIMEPTRGIVLERDM